MRFKLIFVSLFVFCFSKVQAQEQVYKFFTIKEGLPTNNIFKIKFDNKGFLWIAHDNGISKYDGFTFKNFISPLQKSNVYTDIFIGPDGKIWVTNLGLQAFYIENDEMVLFKSFELNFPPSTLKIGFLKNGNMIFNAEGGLIEYDVKTKKEHKYSLQNTIQYFAVNKDTVYFTGNYNRKMVKFHNGRFDSTDNVAPYSVIYVDDSTIVSTYNTSKELYIRYGKNYENSIVTNFIFNYNYSERYGNDLYIFTTGNVFKLPLNDRKFEPKQLFDGRSYTHFAKDNLGNSWFSTLNDGIIFMPSSKVTRLEVNEKSNFTKLVQFRNRALGLTQDNILYDLTQDSLRIIIDLNAEFGYKPVIVCKNLNNKYLLLGNSRFILIDTNFKYKPYIQELAMKDASLDNKDYLYMATTGNIFYHKFNDEVKSKFANQLKFNTLDNAIKRINIIGRFTNVRFDTINQVLYFGGVPGLFRVKDGKNPIEIKDGKNQIFSTFMEYRPPFVIVGTIQSGLYILKDGAIFKHFDNFNSTIGNTIFKIKIYNNSIWILSNRGIHAINMQNFNIQSFSYIGAVNLLNGSDFTINNDVLYLITGQKLYKADIREIRKNAPRIPMYFKYISSGGVKNYNLSDLEFDYNQNSFEIGIESPAASVLGNVEYQYRINNNSWLSLKNNQRELYLSQLSPGTYTLSIRQVGIPKLYTLTFKIKGPFWDNWWFYTLLIAVFVIIIVLLYINRINNIRTKTNAEIEKFKLEKALQLNVLSSIRSQMNPHFLFNALNTIQSYIYLNDKKQAINYLGKFSVLTRKILEESNRETISLAEEIETLDLYLQLEKMRFENTLEYHIKLEGIRFTEQIKIPPMLIQPYVENAVKHGLMHKSNNRHLNITFKFIEVDKMLEVYIEDNGIGRKRSEEINSKRNAAHRSFSTRANKTRLDILNSDRINPISIKVTDKTDEFNNPTGTLVQINIPVL